MKEVPVDHTIVGRIGTVNDSYGNPAKVDGPWTWMSDSTTATLNPAEDGLSCEVVPSGELDDVVQVTARADADTSDGVENLMVVFEPLVFVGGKATVVAGTWDEPVVKPPEA